MQGHPNRASSQGELKVHIHDCWSGRTSRASLHAAKQIVTYGPIDNQWVTPCVSISAILQCNLTHIARWNGSYCAVKWLRLMGKRIEVRTHGSCVRFYFSWQVSSKQVNQLIAAQHVGTHGPCVRSNNHAFTLPFILSERTNRASLHRNLRCFLQLLSW